MASIRKKWWGIIVSLNKDETCYVTSSALGASGIAAAIGGPWGWFVAAVIFVHKIWIHAQVGTSGVKLHITWAGILIKVKRRGDASSCDPITPPCC